LLSGGTVYHNIGYYFYFYLSERGEIAGIEDAYIHFDDIFGMPLDVMVGQFQTSDPLLKRELRLTFEDYMIYKSHPSGSITDLTYDRGVMMVYSIGKTGTDVVAMMVNGNGKVEAGDDRKFDVDSHKNYGVRISQSLGGFFRIGGFYYRGSESQNGRDNTITYIGPDLSLSAGSLDLEMQYLERRDTDPLFTGATEADTKGMVAELTVSPQGDRSRVYITGLYNWIKSDLSDLDYQSATLSLSYLLARNLRLVGEYTRDLERKSNRLVLGTVTGF
jgi:hypothetical protein